MSTVNIVNQSSAQLDLKALDKALHKYVKLIANAWGEHVWRIVSDARSNGYTLALVDSLDVAGALGYHDLSPEGKPYGLIGKDACEQNGIAISSVFAHELAEMIGDPLANQWVNDGQGTLWARELCDAVENYTFSIDGLEMSDFVTPAFFNPYGTQPFSYMGIPTRPFETTAGGYQIYQQGGQIGQTFGQYVRSRDAKLSRKPFERAVKRGISAAA